MADEASPTSIDEDAPAISRRSRLIAAPRAAVWRVQTDVDRWPEWQADISAASIDGAFAAGSTISWSTVGVDGVIPSVLSIVEPERRILWRGAAMGVVGIHEWRFGDVEGGTRVDTAESWTGASVDANPTGTRTFLDGSLDAWLGHLNDRVMALQGR